LAGKALSFTLKGLKIISIIGIVVLLIDSAALAGEVLPPVIIPNTVKNLQDFRTKCQQIADWSRNVAVKVPHTRKATCGECWDEILAGSPGNNEITLCADEMPGVQNAFNQLKEAIGQLKEQAANSCAVKPGGYYNSRRPRNQNCIRFEDRPNTTPKERVCCMYDGSTCTGVANGC
jgi:hypothetical protein